MKTMALDNRLPFDYICKRRLSSLYILHRPTATNTFSYLPPMALTGAWSDIIRFGWPLSVRLTTQAPAQNGATHILLLPKSMVTQRKVINQVIFGHEIEQMDEQYMY